MTQDEYDEYAALMQEPPGGENHGSVNLPISTAADGVGASERRRSLNAGEAQREEFLVAGGWGVVRAGTHRGVLHRTEHIDLDEVRAAVEKHLGISIAEIEEAYKNGRPTVDRVRSRALIDAQLLALSRSGGNMLALARVLGWEVEGERSGGPSCRKMERALERARAAEERAA